MSKDINIKYKQYRLPFEIVIDGVTYPNNQHNWDVIAEYNETEDETVLNKLSNYSFNLMDMPGVDDRRDDSAKHEVEIDN